MAEPVAGPVRYKCRKVTVVFTPEERDVLSQMLPSDAVLMTGERSSVLRNPVLVSAVLKLREARVAPWGHTYRERPHAVSAQAGPAPDFDMLEALKASLAKGGPRG